MDLEPFEKLIITQMNVRKNVRVVGIKPERDGSKTYFFQPLRQDFLPSITGTRLIRVTSRDIESKEVNIEKHVIRNLK